MLARLVAAESLLLTITGLATLVVVGTAVLGASSLSEVPVRRPIDD
jgi:hypothetical protein